jgi:predicted ATPase
VYSSLGVYTSYSYYLTYLASAQLAAGHAADALTVIDEGLSRCQTQLARFHEPELLRLKGECLSHTGDAAGAEDLIRRALAMSQRDKAKSFELRAAISLGRLLRDTRSRNDARAVLQTAYDSFDEGFETLDLRTARSLLAELT